MKSLKKLPVLARTKLIKDVESGAARTRISERYAPRHKNAESFAVSVGQSAIKSAVTSRVEEERQRKLEE